MWKLLLLFFLFFFNVLSYAQDLQSRIQQFHIDVANLSNVSERPSPDTLIAKGKRVLKSYQAIVAIDSTIAEPYLLFLPFRAIAEGYDQKKEYQEAIPYYEQAAGVAIKYVEKLGGMGLNMDGYLSMFNSLRDDYFECDMPDKALALSQELLEMDRQYVTGQVAYQQSRISEILWDKGKQEEALQYDSLSILSIEQYGNTEPEFYVTTPVRNALVSLVSTNKFNEALAFMNANRERVNKLIVGKDSLELSQLATINMCMYRTYMEVGMFEKAVNTAFLVSNYIKATQDTACVDYAVWLHNAACAYLAIYQSSQNDQFLNDILALLNKVDKIWKNVKNRNSYRDYATYLGTRGDFLTQTKQMRKAEECYRKAISLHTKQKASEQDILSDLIRLAFFYGVTDKDEDAINLYTSLKSRYGKLQDSLHLVRVYMSLTTEYLKTNNLKEAERYATMAYQISSLHYPNTIVYAEAEGNLSEVYALMGLADRADELRTQSTLAKQRLGVIVSPDELLDVYDKYLTRFSDVLRYYPDTLQWYTKLIAPYCEKIISDKAYKEPTQATALKLLAKIEMFTKEYLSAEKHFLSCLDIERKLYGKKDNRYLTTMNNLSYCYLLDGNNDKCRELAQQIIKYDPSHENYENLLGVGLLTKDTTLTETALKDVYDRSVDFLTSRFLFMSSSQREDFIDGDNIGISNLVLPAVSFPKSMVCSKYAYNAALVSKGLLLNTTNDIETAASSSSDDNVRRLYQRLLDTRNKINNATDSLSLSKFKDDIESTEKELLNLITESHDFSLAIRTQWSDVQRSLGSNDVAVEFITADQSILNESIGKELYCALVIRKKWIAPRCIVLGKKDDVDRFVRMILDAFNNSNGLQGTRWRYISGQLYKRVWEPLCKFLNPNDTIYFSPTGMLTMAPLEALADVKGQMISNEYFLRRVSSTRELCIRGNGTTPSKAVLFGGLKYDSPQDGSEVSQPQTDRVGWQELPATATEVETIAKELSNGNIKVTLYEKNSGTEKAFKALSGKSIDILHLATHGFYFNDTQSNTLNFLRSIDITPNKDNSVSPLRRTGLMLSGGQVAWLGLKSKDKNNDNILLSAEIAALNFHHVGLVVLSACQTGLGDVSEDGIVGLQRAFKMAGAGTMVMTLWKVDDKATAYMMSSFYEQLAIGKSKREAFYTAQDAVKLKFPEPFYWAPFIMLD